MSGDFSSTDVLSFVKDWLSFDPSSRVGGPRHYAAATQLTLQLHFDPFAAWLLVGLIASSTANPALLAHLGAGPIEDLLSNDGSHFGPLIASEARKNSSIRAAVSSVWLCRHDVSPPVLAALQAAVPGFRCLEACSCDESA